MPRDLTFVEEQFLSTSIIAVMFICFLASILILCIGLLVLYFQARRTADRLASLQRQSRRMQKEIERTSVLAGWSDF